MAGGTESLVALSEPGSSSVDAGKGKENTENVEKIAPRKI
jgi:hypothetical protein